MTQQAFADERGMKLWQEKIGQSINDALVLKEGSTTILRGFGWRELQDNHCFIYSVDFEVTNENPEPKRLSRNVFVGPKVEKLEDCPSSKYKDHYIMIEINFFPDQRYFIREIRPCLLSLVGKGEAKCSYDFEQYKDTIQKCFTDKQMQVTTAKYASSDGGWFVLETDPYARKYDVNNRTACDFFYAIYFRMNRGKFEIRQSIIDYEPAILYQ